MPGFSPSVLGLTIYQDRCRSARDSHLEFRWGWISMLIWDVSCRMERRTASISSSFFKVIFHTLCVYPDSPQQALQEAGAALPPPLDKQKNRHRMCECPAKVTSSLLRRSPVGQWPARRNHKGRRLQLTGAGRQHGGRFLVPQKSPEAGSPPPAGPSAFQLSLPSGPRSHQRFWTCFGVKGKRSLSIQGRSNQERKTGQKNVGQRAGM